MLNKMMIACVAVLVMILSAAQLGARPLGEVEAFERQKAGGGNSNDNCEDFTIRIRNNKPQEIRVTGVRYWDNDDEKWRQETSWLPLGIAPQVTRNRKRNLEHVGNDVTKLRVYFRTKVGGSSWSSITNRTGPDFTCRDRAWVLFTVQ